MVSGLALSPLSLGGCGARDSWSDSCCSGKQGLMATRKVSEQVAEKVEFVGKPQGRHREPRKGKPCSPAENPAGPHGPGRVHDSGW